jgi:hypothetical protein
MALRRQSVCHPHRIGPAGLLGTSDLFASAALAWVKERSRAQ